MANPSKQKGTAAETEIVRMLAARGIVGVRTPPGSNFDVRVGPGMDGGLDCLWTRPDHGQWLVTIRAQDFLDFVENTVNLFELDSAYLNIESKRYTRFSLHAIFEKKFGGKK